MNPQYAEIVLIVLIFAVFFFGFILGYSLGLMDRIEQDVTRKID